MTLVRFQRVAIEAGIRKCDWVRVCFIRASLKVMIRLGRTGNALQGMLLERKLQPKLDGACPMCIEWMEKAIAGIAISSRASSRGIGRFGSCVAADRITWGIALRGVVNTELSVIDNVEALYAELKVAFARQRKVLEQRGIKVCPVRIVEHIAARVPKGETARSSKSSRIQQKGSKALGIVAAALLYALEAVLRAPNQIRVGRVHWREAVGYTGVINRGDAVVAAVVNAERNAGLEQGQAGDLPFFQERMRYATWLCPTS